MIGPGTVTPQILDAGALRSVSQAGMILTGPQRLFAGRAADTNFQFIVTYGIQPLSDVSRRIPVPKGGHSTTLLL